MSFSAEPWFTKVAVMGGATSEIARGQTNVSYSSQALISPTNPPTLRPTHYPPTHSVAIASSSQALSRLRAFAMYRSRSRSPPMLVLPQDQLRYAELETRISKLEVEVAKVSKDVRGWKDWESYLYQVWFWARDVAAALAKFPWRWKQPSPDDTGTSTDMVEP